MSFTGTKYFATSTVRRGLPLSSTENLRLMTPRRHCFQASNTPEPELPVVATSGMAEAPKRARHSSGMAAGANSTFAQWQGCTVLQSNPDQCTVTVPEGGLVNVIATFSGN